MDISSPFRDRRKVASPRGRCLWEDSPVSLHRQTDQPKGRLVSSSTQPGGGESVERPPKMMLQPETRPISQDQLVAEVKGIYAGLVMVETKCIQVDNAQSSSTDAKLNNDQWQALIALHRTLLHEHHDFLIASQLSSASPPLRRRASKYAMPARMRGGQGSYRTAIEGDGGRDREIRGEESHYWSTTKAPDKLPSTGRLYEHPLNPPSPNRFLGARRSGSTLSEAPIDHGHDPLMQHFCMEPSSDQSRCIQKPNEGFSLRGDCPISPTTGQWHESQCHVGTLSGPKSPDLLTASFAHPPLPRSMQSLDSSFLAERPWPPQPPAASFAPNPHNLVGPEAPDPPQCSSCGCFFIAVGMNTLLTAKAMKHHAFFLGLAHVSLGQLDKSPDEFDSDMLLQIDARSLAPSHEVNRRSKALINMGLRCGSIVVQFRPALAHFRVLEAGLEALWPLQERLCAAKADKILGSNAFLVKLGEMLRARWTRKGGSPGSPKTPSRPGAPAATATGKTVSA